MISINKETKKTGSCKRPYIELQSAKGIKKLKEKSLYFLFLISGLQIKRKMVTTKRAAKITKGGDHGYRANNRKRNGGTGFMKDIYRNGEEALITVLVIEVAATITASTKSHLISLERMKRFANMQKKMNKN